jgi:hypothetical protein
MRFDAISVQAVKAQSQRNLALHWQALHARFGLPSFTDFAPGDRAHDPRSLLVWTIDQQNGERTYRHLYGGDYVFEAFGADATIEAVPDRLRDIFKSGLDECVASAAIVYMSIATFDPADHRVDCERLLLPFGSDGDVTHILASLQLVSVEGSFERRTILRQFAQQADVTFCGRIEPPAQLVTTAAASGADRSRSA